MAYTIVERYLDGIKVVGYGIIDDATGAKKKVSEETALKQGLKGRLINADVVGTNKDILLIKDEIQNAQFGSEYRIESRVLNQEGELTSYIVMSSKNISSEISKAQAWELARKGLLEGVKATLNGDCKILESTGEEELHKTRSIVKRQV